MAIPDEDVAQVRAATDIVALIGEHAALASRAGAGSGLCPFHAEKTPSFCVNAREGLYYCFGCQASGDAISFVRAVEHLDFADAVRHLADRAGVTIHEDAEAGRDRKRRAELLEAMEAASPGTTSGCCRRPTPARPGTTCARAGYDGAVVRQFRLGWAPDDWDALSRALGLSERVLTDAGLGFVNRRGRPRTPSGPGSSSRSATPRAGRWRLGGPHPARPAPTHGDRAPRAQVQELPGDRHLLQAADPLRPQLGQARRHRQRRGRGVRGLHRRHRVLPGRACPGPWPPAAPRWPRSTSRLLRNFAQAHRAGLRRRQRRPVGHLSGSTSGSAATRSTWRWPPCRRARPGRAGRAGPRGPAPGHRRGPPVPPVPGGPGPRRGRPDDGRGPGPGRRRRPRRGGRAPRRPGARPVRDAGRRPLPARARPGPRAPRGGPAGAWRAAPAGDGERGEPRPWPTGPAGPGPGRRAGRPTAGGRRGTGRRCRRPPADGDGPRPGDDGAGPSRRSARPGAPSRGRSARAGGPPPGRPPPRGGRPTGWRRCCSPTNSSAGPSWRCPRRTSCTRRSSRPRPRRPSCCAGWRWRSRSGDEGWATRSTRWSPAAAGGRPTRAWPTSRPRRADVARGDVGPGRRGRPPRRRVELDELDDPGRSQRCGDRLLAWLLGAGGRALMIDRDPSLRTTTAGSPRRVGLGGRGRPARRPAAGMSAEEFDVQCSATGRATGHAHPGRPAGGPACGRADPRGDRCPGRTGAGRGHRVAGATTWRPTTARRGAEDLAPEHPALAEPTPRPAPGRRRHCGERRTKANEAKTTGGARRHRRRRRAGDGPGRASPSRSPRPRRAEGRRLLRGQRPRTRSTPT